MLAAVHGSECGSVCVRRVVVDGRRWQTAAYFWRQADRSGEGEGEGEGGRVLGWGGVVDEWWLVGRVCGL